MRTNEIITSKMSASTVERIFALAMGSPKQYSNATKSVSSAKARLARNREQLEKCSQEV